jgi:hypothetical protein
LGLPSSNQKGSLNRLLQPSQWLCLDHSIGWRFAIKDFRSSLNCSFQAEREALLIYESMNRQLRVFELKRCYR